MRIGLFAPRLAQADATGIGRYVREFVMALAQRAGSGDVLVLATTPEPRQPDWVPDRVKLRTVRWPRDVVHAAWCLGAGPQVERTMGDLDVLHLLYPFPPVRSRAPQVTTLHDVMPLEHPEWFPRSEPIIYRRSARLMLRRSARIVVPSRYVAERAAATLRTRPAQVTVVPLGVTNTFAGRSSAEGTSVCAKFGVQPGRYAVCIGAVSARKNLIPVIHALAVLPDRLPLVAIGPDGHRASETQAEIDRLADSVSVRRTGWIPDDDAAALVANAALLVHPALEEGFGIVPLEAMAAGTPVVAARVSSVPEVVGEAGVLVDEPSDPEAWAAAIGRLLDPAGPRQELIDSGRRRVATFSWEATADEMLKIYGQVAGQANRT